MANAKVNWYKNDVMVIADAMSDELIAQIALQIEGEAKANAPVDTGFMRNAIYTITPQGSQRSQATVTAKATADRELAGAPSVGEHEAVVHGAAEYTVYQEMRRGFMYGAAEKVAAQVDAIIEAVGRQYFGR